MPKTCYNRIMDYIKQDGGRSLYYKNRTGDCVVRSIALALEQDYKKTWLDLFELGTQLGEMPNAEKVYTRYLKDHGYRKNRPQRCANGHLQQIIHYRGGPCIMRTRDHLTYINRHGDICDSWDCRMQLMFSYYTRDDVQNLN